jgi:phosphoglycolate phosphatase
MRAPERFDALVFDWDGTLVDSTALIAEAILRAADEVGVAVPDRSQASHVIGLGMVQALARVVPGLPREKLPDFIAHYQAHYRGAEDTIRLFGGTREALAALHGRGVRLAIATGKTRSGLARALERSGLEGYFAALRCADQTQPKPHPAMLLELAEELGTLPARLLMVGDTTHDLGMAQAAGAQAVGVTFGAHSREELESVPALALFDSPGELHRWLMEEFAGPQPARDR